MIGLVVLGLAALGGYGVYDKYFKQNSNSDLPSPLDPVARSTASQPQQLSPLSTVYDPRADGANQPWYDRAAYPSTTPYVGNENDWNAGSPDVNYAIPDLSVESDGLDLMTSPDLGDASQVVTAPEV